MNIGQASSASGVTAKMIRYYESIGLIQPAPRTDAGYRVYSDTDVHTLRFIKRSRDLGFSLAKIEKLIALWNDRSRASAEVKALAMTHVDELRQKIAELEDMARTLENLAKTCQGNDRPDCPILEGLARTD
ncbi:MAG: Cu(I)-responsive transcriptional regulator [Pseudomonadota bacterium]